MKTFAILGALLLLEVVAAQPQFLPGRRTASRAAKPLGELCTTVERKRVCNEDVCAKGFVQCAGVGKGLEFDCSDPTPYCSQATGEAKCVAEKPKDCGDDNTATDFICLSAGIFPDLTDCKKFVVCTPDGAGDYYVDAFECDDQYVFDPVGRNDNFCRLTYNRYCITANCKGSSSNILLSYPGFSGQIGATCRKDKAPIPFRCESGFVADLKTLPVECKLNCRGPSKAVYPDDDTKYYECVYSAATRRYESKLKSCFRFYYFDAVKKTCIKSLTTPAPTTTVGTTTGAAGSTTGAAESTTGAAGTTTGAAGSTTGAAESTTGAAGTTTGAAGSTTGAAESTTGAAGSTTGAAVSTTGDAGSTTGAAESTTGAAESTTGAAESTTGAAESTTGAAESTA